MFVMEKKATLVKLLTPVWRRWRAWIGGMVLLLIGQAVYEIGIVGGYTYHALQFIERDLATPHPQYSVYINGRRARSDTLIKLPDGVFVEIQFSEPIRSTSRRAVYSLVPLSGNPNFRTHRFEIEAKSGVCHAAFEIRGIDPVFVGCMSLGSDSD